MLCFTRLIIFLSLLATSVLAEPAPNNDEHFASGTGLGLAAGLGSGTGLAYRQHFASKWGLNVVAGFIMTGSEYLIGDLGLNITRTLSYEDVTRFYLVGGLSSYNLNEKINNDWNRDIYLNVGAGFGMEFHFTKHIGLAIEIPLSATFLVNKKANFSFSHAWPIPNLALSYYF